MVASDFDEPSLIGLRHFSKHEFPNPMTIQLDRPPTTTDSPAETRAAVQSAVTQSVQSLWRTTWFKPAMALIAIVFALYCPSLSYEFVNWDDPWYVINNPFNKSWDWVTLKAIATEVINRNYAPLTMFALLVEHTVFGVEPAGYHAVNMLLHGVNAGLVYVLVKQLTGRASVGLWTAVIFAVHPVQIESVVWVSSLKGLLCSTFILAHLICCMRPERTPQQEGYGLLFFGLALLSKALTIVVPAIVLLYDVWVCRKKWSEAIARQFMPGLLCVWLLLTTMQAQETTLGGLRAHFGLSKPHVLAVDSIILWKYVGMLMCPTNLCVLYDPPTHGIATEVCVAIGAWCVVCYGLWRQRHRPLLLVSAAAWLLLLIPVLNLTRITTLMNDRYLYLPLIPFFGVLVHGWVSLIERLLLGRSSLATAEEKLHQSPLPAQLQSGLALRWLKLSLPACMAVLMGVLASQHLPVWRNDKSLWTHTISHLPNVPVVRIQYAWMLWNQGRAHEAIDVMKSALTKTHPDKLDRARIEETLVQWTEQLAEEAKSSAAKPTVQTGVRIDVEPDVRTPANANDRNAVRPDGLRSA